MYNTINNQTCNVCCLLGTSVPRTFTEPGADTWLLGGPRRTVHSFPLVPPSSALMLLYLFSASGLKQHSSDEQPQQTHKNGVL